MLHKFYHGCTGKVWNVTKRAMGVEINKQVENRIIRSWQWLVYSTNSSCQSAINNHISSLCKQNLFREAIEYFVSFQLQTQQLQQPQQQNALFPSTYAHLLAACSKLKSLRDVRIVHQHLSLHLGDPDVILCNHVLNAYGKCGSLADASRMFDEMPYRNLISWTSIISAYSQNRHEDVALDLYLRMLREGLSCSHPDGFCLGSVVRSCTGLGDAELGRQLHCQSVKFGCSSDLIVQNALVTMYSKLDRVKDASVVFERIRDKDLVSWGSIISGFAQGGFGLEALLAFKEMVTKTGIIVNEFHFGSAFSACASVYRLEYGEQIHGLCVKFGLEGDPHAGCSLSDMYARVGHLDLSKKAFRQIWMPDLVSWNSIISAFSNGGFVDEMILFFSEMRDSGLKPDDITVRCMLCACMGSDYLFQGQMLHSYAVKMGLVKDVAVCNSLLAMYSKCVGFSTALALFQEMHESRDLVSWNTILTSCLQNRQPEEVFRLFNLMRSLTELDHITLNTVLSACGELAYLEMGNQVHAHALKVGLEDDQVVRNSLIDTYAKCGSLDLARKLFELMGNDLDVFSWSSLIVGYAQFGHGEQALNLFTSMIKSDVKPNHITFVGVLSACSRVGLVDEGYHYFNIMEAEYGIVPTREHCSCVVDLLARAGKLDEAKRFIDQMPLEPDIVMWKTLLSSCRVYKNVEIAKKAAEGILEIDPSNSAAYVLLCNTLASSGCWDDVARLRKLMRSNDVKKSPGKSWIKVKGDVKVFIAEDKSHPETDDIYVILDVLGLDMGKAGRAPRPSV